MVRLNSESTVERSWTTYSKSLSGRHDCPLCDTQFKFTIPRRYWFLWLDIVVAAGVFTTVGLNYVSVMDPNSRTVILMPSSIVISVPVLVWGTLFLVLNRRILNRLDTEAICNTG
jgi:hypothetical protein